MDQKQKDYSECFCSERERIKGNQQTLANSRYTALLNLMRPPTSETANNPWWDPIFFPLIIYSLGLGLSFLQLLALQLERFIFFPLYAFPIHAEWLGQYALCGGWANYFQPYVLPVEIWSFSSHINHTVSLIHFLVLLEVKPFWIFLFSMFCLFHELIPIFTILYKTFFFF